MCYQLKIHVRLNYFYCSHIWFSNTNERNGHCEFLTFKSIYDNCNTNVVLNNRYSHFNYSCYRDNMIDQDMDVLLHQIVFFSIRIVRFYRFCKKLYRFLGILLTPSVWKPNGIPLNTILHRFNMFAVRGVTRKTQKSSKITQKLPQNGFFVIFGSEMTTFWVP